MNYIFSNDYGVIGYMSRHIAVQGRVFSMMLPANMNEVRIMSEAPDTAAAISARTIHFHRVEKTGDWLVCPVSARMLLDATSAQCAQMGVVVTSRTPGVAYYDNRLDNKIGVRFDAKTGETWLSDFGVGKRPRDLVNFHDLGYGAKGAAEYLKHYIQRVHFDREEL